MAHLTAKPSRDGQTVVLDLAQQNPAQKILFRISAAEIGLFSTGLLRMALACAKRTGAFCKMQPEAAHKVVQAHQVAVASNSSAEATVLVFAIGTTQLSISVPRSGAAELGRALLTVSADTKTSQ